MATRRSLDSGRAEYEARLQELFEESDVTDKGYLDVDEVNALCSRLQLGRLKDNVVKSLKERSVNKEKVHYEDFRDVFFALLEELEAQQSKSPRKSHSKGLDTPDQSPKLAPKLVIGRKKYGRRSLPFNEDMDLKGQGAPEGSYSQFLQDLDSNDRSSPSVEVEGKHVKRRRHTRASGGSTSTPTPSVQEKATEETYEAEGQLATEEDHGIETETGMRQLRDVCHHLGVGASGVLNQTEFGSVCAYIGMGNIKEKELAELFLRMDTNRDGLISLSELISGLPQSSSLHSPQSASTRLRSSTRSLTKTPRSRSHSRTRAEERGTPISRNTTPSQFVSGDFTGLFSSIEHSHEGFAKSEDVIDYWDGLGITNGADVLLSLGFNPNGQVKLADLTTALDQELTSPSAPDPVHHVALVCYQQEVRHLKSVVDQAKEESKRLKLDLSESNARNTLLAREVDERHAQLDKSWESKLVAVDKKYQEQIKALQTELDKEREAGAAQASRLRTQLEELQTKSGQEEQRLAEKVAGSQKEISKLERELAESSEKVNALAKQNENLKKDMHHKLQQEKSPVPDDHKQELMEREQMLEMKMEENKKLKDENDELLAQLEEARQKLQTSQRQGHVSTSKSETTPVGSSRIPVMRGSDITLRHRNSLSSMDASETDDDDASVASARGLRPPSLRKRQKLAGSALSLDADLNELPSLSRELSQQQTEEILERERKDMEQRYRLEISALEERHDNERQKILNNFEQEKEWLIEEQKIREETILAEQLKDLQTAFAKEKQDLVQKHESEKNYIQHRHEQEMKAIQERVEESESHLDGNVKLENLVHNLEAQLARCHDDLRDLENQKSDLDIQLRQQEVSLRHEFEEERRNLAERFSRELEQRQLSHKYQMEQLFTRGAEGLTGKLRDDFLSLVRKHTEEEVGHSQAAILSQLHRDRSGIAAALEKEKSQLYEEAESEKHAIVERYEMQISALRAELNHTRSQLDAERKLLSEAAQKSGDATDGGVGEDVVQNLRREMEIIASRKHGKAATSASPTKGKQEIKEELVIELARMKESFEAEKRELETQKTLLEEELTELQGLLEAERKKTGEMDSLKETMKTLKAEKREVEGMVENMKEKLFQAYQQKEVEHSDLEGRLKAARAEGQGQGKEEGLRQGREEGREQGRKDGYEEGFAEGMQRGEEEGYKRGKTEGEGASNKSTEDMKSLLESLRQEKSVLENKLRQEKEKSNKVFQQAQDRDRIKASFDSILKEKHELEMKYQDSYTALVEEHQAEKDHMMQEIRRLEAQRLNVQSDKKAIEAHIGAVQQELELAKQEINEEVSLADDESGIDSSQGQGTLKEQMTLLSYQLKEAQTAQEELGLLKEEYETLLLDKSELEETVRKLRAKSSEDDNATIKTQMAQIKVLGEEKQKIQEMLDQTSDQLVKASTSMALAQSKFVRELETLKKKAKSTVEVESYTQLQISLVEHQRLVMTLQDAIRERESLVDRVIREGDEEKHRITQVMEAKVKDMKNKLDNTQEQLLKQKEKYKQMCTTSNRRNLVLKDLYVENADLMKTLADSDVKRRMAERLGRKLTGKCESYKRTIDRLCTSLSR